MRFRRRPANAATRGPSQPRRGGDLGFEATLWQAADKLRSNMDAAEYKHVALGLIFLKYISRRLRAATPSCCRRARRQSPRTRRPAAPPACSGSRRSPAGARSARADQPGLGKPIDDAMAPIAAHNPASRASSRPFTSAPASRARCSASSCACSTASASADDALGRDVLGRVYEYFLTRFASAEGKNGGQFYTPRSRRPAARRHARPAPGSTVYDPACGSGGMFVQSERFLVEHGGKHGDLKLYGQESNPTTWRLARMNLAIRGIAGDLGREHADSFHHDQHPELRADYVLANPPFNTKDWGAARLQDDPRWRFGVPRPKTPTSRGSSTSSTTSRPAGPRRLRAGQRGDDREHRQRGRDPPRHRRGRPRRLHGRPPGQLFYSTQIPVSLWLLANDKADPRLRDRRGEVLMIDARDLGTMVDRTHRELRDDEVARLVDLYHTWRGDPVPGDSRHRDTSTSPACAAASPSARSSASAASSPPAATSPPPAPRPPSARSSTSSPTSTRALRAQLAQAAELDKQLAALLDHLSARPHHDRAPARLGHLHPRRHQGRLAPYAIAGGPFGSDLVRADYVDDGVPVIRGGNLGEGERRFYTDDLVFVSETKADAARPPRRAPRRRHRHPARHPRAGRPHPQQHPVAPLHPVAEPDEDHLRPRRADPEYIYYWLLTPEVRDYIEPPHHHHRRAAHQPGDPRATPVRLPPPPSSADRPRPRPHRRPRRPRENMNDELDRLARLVFRDMVLKTCPDGQPRPRRAPRRAPPRRGRAVPRRARGLARRPAPRRLARDPADRVRHLPERHRLQRRRLRPRRRRPPHHQDRRDQARRHRSDPLRRRPPRRPRHRRRRHPDVLVRQPAHLDRHLPVARRPRLAQSAHF
jgi:type I restriction enzyme M protein